MLAGVQERASSRLAVGSTGSNHLSMQHLVPIEADVMVVGEESSEAEIAFASANKGAYECWMQIDS